MPKVLHVVENMYRGAVENWLLRMLEHGQRRGANLDWTFYCALGQQGTMDAEAQTLGARVLHSPVPIARKARFIGALRQEIRAGAYDVLHCHHDLVSAVYLVAAARLPLRRRIVHVHNADESVLTSNPVKQSLYRGSMRRICLAMADRIVGNSNHTLDTFLAERPRQAGRDSVLYYGVDPRPFETANADRAGFRRQLGLPEDALVFLFGGRLVPEKNPVFAVDVLARLRRLEPRAVGIFAGAGSEERATLSRARDLGLQDAVRLLGWRTDLPEIMSCSDWFILPHPEHPLEGFGLTVVEAQLAGLRMLLSNGIPDDPLLPTAKFRRLALNAGADAWAEAALELLHDTPSKADALAALKASPMDMDRALDDLLALYA